MQRKILIVDDEAELLELLKEQFTLEGWSVKPCSDGEQALSEVQTFHPEVIISDISMPKMDGLTLLQNLNEKGLHVPVILVTGFGDAKNIQRAWALGAFDLVNKPFSLEDLSKLASHAAAYGPEYVKAALARAARLKRAG